MAGLNRLREVRATFANSAAMQTAADKLAMSGFDRADLSMPAHSHVQTETTPESATKPVSTEADARQLRTLGSSSVGTVAALAAAGVTIATGGAALPAVAAAVLAGGLAGGATYAASGAASGAEQRDRNEQAEEGGVLLLVNTPTAAKVEQARTILAAAGGTHITSFS
jgi:hypothetical protein